MGMVFQMIDTLDMGGAERMTVNIANLLADQGIESHVIVSRYTGVLERNLHADVQVKHLQKRSFKDVEAFRKLYAYVKLHQPDIIHCHATSLYWGVALKLIYPKFKLIWHDHFGLSDQLDKHPRTSYKLLSKWVDGIIVVNQVLEDFWKSFKSKEAHSVVFLPNFPLLSPSQQVKNSVFTFVCLANFRPQKNQLNLIKAVQLLIAKGKIFKVLLAGQLIDKSWHAKIEYNIDKLLLSDYVQILGPVEDVSDLLSQAHAGVLSSDSEGLPVSLLEYALMALPVITTDVGDCSKVVNKGEYGWIVKPNNPQELAAAMEDVIDDYQSAVKKAKSLNLFVQKNYGALKFYDAYSSFVNHMN